MKVEPKSGTSTNFSFGKITYTQADAGKTYKYTVTETASVPYIGIDTTVHNVTVKVVDDGKGTLTATPTYVNGKVFTDTYTTSTDTTLSFTKQLKGRSFKDGDWFAFTIARDEEDEASKAAPLPEETTVKVEPKSGTSKGFSFGKITYTQADAGKTYKYTVTETAGINGVRIDSTVHKVTVTISDDGKGNLTATPKYVNGKVFTNTYTTSSDATLSFTKQLKGRDFQDGDCFEFTVARDATDSASKTAPLPDQVTVKIEPKNGNAQGFSFGKINYTQDDAGKTYKYTVTETASVPYVGKDTTVHKVTVKVVDDGNGTLTATPTYVNGEIFTNTYTSSGETALLFTKQLKGRDFADGDWFEFTIARDSSDTASKSAPLPANTTVKVEPKSGTSKDFSFGKITYTQADAGKTYKYTVTETASVPYIGIDTTVHNVTVKVEPKSADKKSKDFSFGKITYTQDDAGKTYKYTVTETASVPYIGICLLYTSPSPRDRG